jgi:hypothetical protein
LGFLVILAACGDDIAPPRDSGGLDAESARCTGHPSCDNGVFCDGAERCMPESGSADARGCVASGSPCAASQTCDEATARCVTMCDSEPDADGDGVAAILCGGMDCDDADPSRFLGNPEVCDAESHDEDCDPTTYGMRDNDGDRSFDAACCNLSPGGTMFCGDDCNDAEPGVNPRVPEVCDPVDNDCDTFVDERLEVPCWDDPDSDGYATLDATMTLRCGGCATGQTDRVPVEGREDCDQTDPSAFPGAIEICDRIDRDCSSGGGVAADEDNDNDGYAPLTATCIPGSVRFGDCNDDEADAHPGQRLFFDVPMCPRGSAPCRLATSVRCLRTTIACPAPIMMTTIGDWDYDCDGTEEPEPAVIGGCGLFGSCVMSPCGPPPGPMYHSACGSLVPYQSCRCAGPMGCVNEDGARPLECR